MNQRRVTEMFPDLFEGVPADTVSRVSSIIGNSRHEGYIPNREDVARLIAVDTGQVSHEAAIDALKARYAPPSAQ